MSASSYTLRSDLEPLPDRMRDLPVDKRGYVVPWFVEWITVDGERVPEFRAMSVEKWKRAIKMKLCWVCGKQLGAYMAFTVGPMCGINKISSEPPSHLECAEWSVRNCPFLSRPQMVRRQGDELAEQLKDNTIGGIAITRNPGVMLIWVTRSYRVERDGIGGVLITMGDPIDCHWWREGRAATREEIEESVATGLPQLEELARQQRGGMEELERGKRDLEKLYP